MKAEPQRPAKPEEPKTAGDLDQELVRAWGWEDPARIPEKIGRRETEARIAKESDFRDTALLPTLQSLLYADLDRAALSQPCRLSPVVSADSSTIYAVVV